MKTSIIYRYKHIQRYREILRVLTRHGFGYLVKALHANISVIPFWRKKELAEPAITTAERLRKVLEELGPTFIKLGQLLSTRPDLLPPVYIRQLEHLQDNVPPEPFESLQKIIERELAQPISAIFQSLETLPLATASIGQVHRGKLINGSEIVIKVQRSNVAQIIATDLEILADTAQYLESRFEWARRYGLSSLVDEFGTTIRDELDYILEAFNASRLQKNLRQYQHIVIPKIYWEFTTVRVLVTEYLAGYKITSDRFPGVFKTQRLVRELIEAFFKQVMEDGFFHADLHPGNIQLTEDERIVLMDFGMMGRIDRHSQDKLARLFIKVLQKDIDGLVNTLIHFGATAKPVDKTGLRREIFYLLDKVYFRSLDQIRVGLLLHEMVRISLKYRIIIPRELVVVTRSLILFESLIERLEPTLNWMEIAKPLGKKLLQKRWDPFHLARESSTYLMNFTETLLEMPDSVQQILKKMEEGKFQLTLEHQNSERFIKKLNIIGNRLSFSLIVAAIIIGTSFIVQRSETSFLKRFPLSEFGFVVAVLMGLWLLVSIIRSGKL